jgi:hypothetical protein
MRYLLDGNAIIALLNETTSPIARRVRCHAPRDFGVSACLSQWPIRFQLMTIWLTAQVGDYAGLDTLTDFDNDLNRPPLLTPAPSVNAAAFSAR